MSVKSNKSEDQFLFIHKQIKLCYISTVILIKLLIIHECANDQFLVGESTAIISTSKFKKDSIL